MFRRLSQWKVPLVTRESSFNDSHSCKDAVLFRTDLNHPLAAVRGFTLVERAVLVTEDLNHLLTAIRRTHSFSCGSL